MIIRNRTEAIAFENYRSFIDRVMCVDSGGAQLAFRGSDAYNLLKVATHAFLMHEAGVLDPGLYSYPLSVRSELVGQKGDRQGDALLDPDAAVRSLASDPDVFNNRERSRLGFPHRRRSSTSSAASTTSNCRTSPSRCCPT